MCLFVEAVLLGVRGQGQGSEEDFMLSMYNCLVSKLATHIHTHTRGRRREGKTKKEIRKQTNKQKATLLAQEISD